MIAPVPVKQQTAQFFHSFYLTQGFFQARGPPAAGEVEGEVLPELHHAVVPFGGELHSQSGVVQIEGFPPLPSTQIVEMNWLADNVVGTIPQLDDEPKVPAL